MNGPAFGVDFAHALARAAAASNIPLGPLQLAAATAYASELLLWNPRAGLTTIDRPELVAQRHFLESFLLAEMLCISPGRGLDVGSGGGFPGLALKILRPQADMTLLEPRQRKAAFLSHMGRVLPGLRCTVDMRPLREHLTASPYDFVTFRAVRVRAPEILRVLRPGGLLLAYSGEGLSALAPELQAVGASLAAERGIPGRSGAVQCWQLKDAPGA
jgi:16S rRNA (guanine527-N7)-methyltransferase